MAAPKEEPKRGGTLTFLSPANAPPSVDGHREGTFAMFHATAPFYSVLLWVNPDNPGPATDFVCDEQATRVVHCAATAPPSSSAACRPPPATT
jgi:hypothetical protein